MTNEQREAIEYLKEMKNNQKDLNKSGYVYANEKIDTVLSLIKEQQEEIEGLKNKEVLIKRYFKKCDLIKQKDKQIDLMAEFIGQDMMCIRPEIECNKMTHDCKDCIKQYFENKVNSSEQN